MSKLFIVPTPIGNLDDITYRAVTILKNSDVILAEDTRTSSKLLSHFGINKKTYSHHQHNERNSSSEILKQIKSGTSFALISDAGTPAISDPGYFLIRLCIENNIDIECLPGPTAFIPALINSGLPCEKFIFEGFLPHKKGKQTKILQLKEEKRTIVIYESPHRIVKTLMQIKSLFEEERRISISRELTKMHEETIRGNFSEIIEHFDQKKPKGEMVLVIEGKK